MIWGYHYFRKHLYSFLVRENLVSIARYVRFLGFFIFLGVPGVLVVRIFIFNYPKTVVFVAIIVSCHAARNWRKWAIWTCTMVWKTWWFHIFLFKFTPNRGELDLPIWRVHAHLLVSSTHLASQFWFQPKAEEVPVEAPKEVPQPQEPQEVIAICIDRSGQISCNRLWMGRKQSDEKPKMEMFHQIWKVKVW